jgi:hypothetical protein
MLVASGCGGSSATKSSTDCGKALSIPIGDLGGQYGGTAYQDVSGVPVVSLAGNGTSCKQLLAFADASEHKKGPNLFAWLNQHKWVWMNYDTKASPYSLFDLDKNDVFIGTRRGQRSPSRVRHLKGVR